MQKYLFNPYATRFTIFDYLPLLVEQGYLQQQGEGYIATDTGHILSNLDPIAARAYIGSLEVSPSLSLSALAIALVERVHYAWQSSELLIKAHQARTQRHSPVEKAPALVQIEWTIWACENAHMVACMAGLPIL